MGDHLKTAGLIGTIWIVVVIMLMAPNGFRLGQDRPIVAATETAGGG